MQDVQGPNSKQQSYDPFLPRAHLQSPQHRYRDQDHQEVGDHIEDRVPKIEVLGVHAVPFEQRVPDFRYRPTLEEEGKAKSDHVDEEDGEDGVAECLLGV